MPDNTTYWENIDRMCYDCIQNIANCSEQPIDETRLKHHIIDIGAEVRTCIISHLTAPPLNGAFPEEHTM